MENALPTSSNHERYLSTKVFGSLDGLRALSIVAVVWHHASGWHRELWHQVDNPIPWSIASRGFLGVDLFFVISGFLIVTLLLRERRRTDTISLRSFYARRFLRIFPPYYLMLLVFGTFAYLKPGATSDATRQELPFALLYVSNLVAMRSPLTFTWSLAAEEQFYLVVPTLEKYASRTFLLVLPTLYVLFILPSFGVFPQLGLPEFFRTTTFGPILLGVILAHVLDNAKGYGAVYRLIGQWWSPIAAGLLVTLICNYPGPVEGWLRLAIHWSLLLLVASCVVRERHVALPVLASWPARRIGAVSYGIYLYHPLALYVAYRSLSRLGLSSVLLFFLASVLATWALAELSFRLYESRFLALKERFGGIPLRLRESDKGVTTDCPRALSNSPAT